MAYIRGIFPVPVNDIKSALGPCGLGAFASASFPLPQNSLKKDCGCGCEGACGLGSIDDVFGSIQSTLSEPSPVFGLSWLTVGVAGLFAFMLLGRNDSDEYRYKLSKLKKQYPRRYRQAYDDGRAAYREARGLLG